LARVLKDEYGEAAVDFGVLSEKLCQGCERLRTYYYTCMPYQSSPPTAEERARYAAMDRFIYSLKKISRFEVRLGKLSHIHGEFVQKRVDVLLSVDLVRMSWGRQIQRAVLLSGDSDLVPAVQAAKDAGVLTQVYYSKRSVHDELLQACDDRFEITREFINSVKLGR
jgi:uncharacterized LabA/DUF88 family protein